MKQKHNQSYLVHQTRPDKHHLVEARSCFYMTKDRKVLLKTKLNCGTNEYGFAFIASFKYVKNRLMATFTPGTSTSSDDGKSFEFTAHTNLTSSLWLT